MVKKTRIATAVAITIAILLTMFARCGRNSEDEFEEMKSIMTLKTTEIWYILRNKSVKLLEVNGYKVVDSFINICFEEETEEYVIKLYVLSFNEKNKKFIKEFKVETQYDQFIVAALNAGTDKICVTDFTLYISDYLRESTFSLQGEKIVLLKEFY